MATLVRDLGKTRHENAGSGPMSQQEALTFFEKAAQRNLGISGTEFLRRWDDGYFKGRLDTKATKVAMLLPMVRKTVARKKLR